MDYNIHNRLLNRELAHRPRHANIRAIYGDQRWIKDLDIVNELDGHDGCVNALSWSKGGGLLASGSDDQRLNIHQYQPHDSSKPFSLATTVQTGHTANIFSVKFMPHSNDRTLVTAAGDSQVRVFDIEYSGRPGGSSMPSAANIPAADRLQGYLNNGTQFLSTADTNVRVYRSHGDRVKRIVTESSPYLFLTCSEDGEVRQWDLRQPSSAYPKPRGGRTWRSTAQDDDTGVPPPLISYKRYHLDLNTISCSPSQPHYIALGGAHLHAFLHDRRMLGRDRQQERAASVSSSGYTDHEDDLMGEATQCVRRFAPNGQRKMKRADNGHITALKISDAHPNEMIASWSGDHIYSFDLVRSADARSSEEASSQAGAAGASESARAKESRDRKRKRAKEGSVLSQEGSGRAGSKARRAPRSANQPGPGDSAALHVQYENGQSEDIPIRDSEERQASPAESAASGIPESQTLSYRIAKISVSIRKCMFTLRNHKEPNSTDPTGYSASFTSAIRFSAAILKDMDEIIRTWRYPIDPDEVEVVLQTTLRRNRESARRFVQASGTLARLLGGQQLATASGGQTPMMDQFTRIVPAPNETAILNASEQFRFDFIKAIVLWLDSGVGALVEGFSSARNLPRFPLPQDAGVEDIDDKLIPYLMRLAGDRPVPNVDASRFEVDENRQLFASERAAVVAFANALKISFEDLSRAILPGQSDEPGSSVVERASAQDRKAALRFWGFKVARGLLLTAGEGINHAFINRAYGGLGRPSNRIESEERALEERLGEIDPEEEDEQAVASVGLRRTSTTASPAVADGEQPSEEGMVDDFDEEQDAMAVEDEASDEMVIPADDVRSTLAAAGSVAYTEDDEAALENTESSSDNNSSNDDDEDNSGDEEEDEESSAHSFLFRNAFSRSSLRTHVQTDVPCFPHTRVYRGHCNVKTVKDVNFFGLNDEYIVSGSDSSHVFIWDKRTSRLLNILEGDGEVVNVVQGHPYEPMLAVSGIDHTIKIFSPDAKSRRDARKGVGVRNIDSSGFSSLRYGRTRFGAARRPARSAAAAGVNGDDPSSCNATTSEPAVPARDESSEDEDNESPASPSGLSSRKRMHDEYRITSQNDVERRGGQREAYITRSMLAQLAARMRLQVASGLGPGGQGGGGGGGGEGDDDEGGDGGGPHRLAIQFDGGGSVVLGDGDDCEVM